MTIPGRCPTCGDWHTGGTCMKSVTNGVTITSGFIPAKKSYEQLERELSGAKAELSALRAAQPLTREKVEELIQEIDRRLQLKFEAGEDNHTDYDVMHELADAIFTHIEGQ